MPRKVKAAAVSSDLLGTADNDVFFIQDGSVNVSGFDPAHDKLLFVGNGYSDILYLGQLHDGLSFDTFNGSHFEVHAGDFNNDGIVDTEISGSGSVVHLLGVDPDSLYGWNLAGG
jgi:hypothetical protein